jgi:O-6-methylguanine DNA methyltransferase
MRWHTISTADGTFLAGYSPKGLAELRFPTAETLADSTSENQWQELTSAAISAILRGEIPEQLPPIDLAGHTSFRIRVWEELRLIPLGETATYAQIAHRVGNPNAVRAVGGACGANPIPLIIPCHRVIASGGKVGGFSGGLRWKRKLLIAEGIDVEGGVDQLEFETRPRLEHSAASF